LYVQLAETLQRVSDLCDASLSPSASSSANLGAGQSGVVQHALTDSLDLCGEIVSNTRDAVEVLNDLLNYDKIEVGGLALDLSYVAIEALVDTVLKPFKGPAKKKDVVIVSDLCQLQAQAQAAGTVPAGRCLALRVMGDKIRLEQVIRNLLSNALKFTSAMGRITVTLKWVDGGLEHHLVPPQLWKHTPHATESTLAKHTPATVSTATMIGGSSFLSAGSASTERYTWRGEPIMERGTSSEPTALDKPSSSNLSRFSTHSTGIHSLMQSSTDPLSCTRYGSVVLQVSDDGTGLTTQQLQQIFFEGVQFNVNELQAGQGSGLGLFIAKGRHQCLWWLVFGYHLVLIDGVSLRRHYQAARRPAYRRIGRPGQGQHLHRGAASLPVRVSCHLCAGCDRHGHR
jgi:signal transduction histidine kinase